jgi:hypothetical protein
VSQYSGPSPSSSKSFSGPCRAWASRCRVAGRSWSWRAQPAQPLRSTPCAQCPQPPSSNRGGPQDGVPVQRRLHLPPVLSGPNAAAAFYALTHQDVVYNAREEGRRRVLPCNPSARWAALTAHPCRCWRAAAQRDACARTARRQPEMAAACGNSSEVVMIDCLVCGSWNLRVAAQQRRGAGGGLLVHAQLVEDRLEVVTHDLAVA